jgi:hypothetical protein
MADAGNFTSTSRRSSKYLFVKHLFLLLHETREVGASFTFFFKTELLKSKMFDRLFLKRAEFREHLAPEYFCMLCTTIHQQGHE